MDETPVEPERAADRIPDGSTRPPAVAVEGLRKRFGSGPDAVTAVDGVSFRVEPGTVLGLLGPNGAGKTTAIKSLLGIVLPDAGRVRICGIDVAANPRAAHARVAAAFEGSRNDYWRLTVRENLRYFATIDGVDPDSVAERHDRLLDRFDLREQADEPVRNLSRGMKQKVSLASVLAGDADVVFLDEPTLGLDVESSVTLRQELRSLADERGLAVVLSSHDMEVVEGVCDRVLVMSDGRVVADGTVGAILDRFGPRGYRVASPDLDRTTIRKLRGSVPVADVDRRTGTPTVEIAVDGGGFYDCMERLRELGVTPRSVSTVEPDLEDALVELTDTGGGDAR
ncbi:MAG: ABC transporter ATP-binding protein [Haloferacaceae archaeon]